MFWGTIGVLAGLVLLYMGCDLMSGGSLTSAISGARSDDDDSTGH